MMCVTEPELPGSRAWGSEGWSGDGADAEVLWQWSLLDALY